MHYRSDFAFLGLPLVDVNIGGSVDGVPRRGVARGWIAVGDIAFGVLPAVGGAAISPRGAADPEAFFRAHPALRPRSSRMSLVLFLLPLVVVHVALRQRRSQDVERR